MVGHHPVVVVPPPPSLLGRTRAAVLRSLDGGTTTSELAGRLGISVSGASQHASALREAGLVSSRRDRNRMLHSVTDLGDQLVEIGKSALPIPRRQRPREVKHGQLP